MTSPLNYNKTYKVERGFYEMDEEDKEEGIDKEEDKEEVNEEPNLEENKEEKEENSGEDSEEKTEEVKEESEEPAPEEKKEEVSEESDLEEDKEEKEENVVEKPENTEKTENRQLKNIFLFIGFLVIIFLMVFLFIGSVRHFKYEGLDFEVIKEGELIFYQTSLPVRMNDQITGKATIADYNFYIRNDPRKLENIPIEGDFNYEELVVFDFVEEFHCDGDGIIAVANLINLLNVMGVEVMQDETAQCDPDGKYTFLRLQPADETTIEQFGPSCYNLNVNGCEILEVTEKYMVELLIRVNQNL